jgi:hypothetical protein
LKTLYVVSRGRRRALTPLQTDGLSTALGFDFAIVGAGNLAVNDGSLHFMYETPGAERVSLLPTPPAPTRLTLHSSLRLNSLLTTSDYCLTSKPMYGES